jgi:gamma-glutamylcyclotransferase (GGCT)/AIG2-like uncharacterized protein YtfP
MNGAIRRMSSLFLYGTLLDPRLFVRLAGCRPPRQAMAATLHDHRRVALRGTPYPTLLRGEGSVRGILLPRLAPAPLARLAAYEGASYTLMPVRVATARGPRRALAWIAPCWRADTRAAWAPRAKVSNLRPRGAIRLRDSGDPA